MWVWGLGFRCGSFGFTHETVSDPEPDPYLVKGLGFRVPGSGFNCSF